MGTSERGATVVDVVVGLFAASVVAVLVSCGVTGSQQTARAIQCSDNLRNINLGVFEYANRSGGELPATSYNVYRCLGPQLGDATDKDMGGNHWRCPSDRLIPSKYMVYQYSYVAAADTVNRSLAITCFNRLAASENRMSKIAPDTISWIEGWAPVMLDKPQGNTDAASMRCLDLDWRDRSAPVAATVDANAPVDSAATVDKGGDVALTDVTASGKATLSNEQIDTCGPYQFLNGFFSRFNRKMALSDVFHRGRANVAFIDGHCEIQPVKGIAMSAYDQPNLNPQWTRDAD